MSDESRVLVFGRAGWLGSAVGALLDARRETVCAPPSNEVDVRDADAVARMITEVAPTAVLNLAAAQPGATADDLNRVNVDGARNVAGACARGGVRLVHISTDALHDGRSAPYADDAPANPLTEYGRSKALGEAAVLALHPPALCVRTSLLWDPRAMDRGTRAFAERIRAGAPCRLFTDEIRCPLHRDALAEALLDLIDHPVRGTLNVVGREAMSRSDFALALLRHFDVAGVERVELVRSADLERAGEARRPRDLRLVVATAEALLDRRLPGVTEMLRPPGGADSRPV